MTTAIKELEFAEKNEGGVFDAFIVNDDLQAAFAQLKVSLVVLVECC